MLLTFILCALAAASSASCKNIQDDELAWPEKYSFEITKLSILSGLDEDIKVWRTEKQSRVEYNKGAVKSFVLKPKKGRETVYQIHPEATEDNESVMKCHSMRRSRFDPSGPTSVLPDVDDFVEIDEEMMKDRKCTKFAKEEVYANIESKKTLWASYDKSLKTWIPVRYEVLDYNRWLGSNDKHELWDFDYFNADFDESEIFNVDEDCSESEPIRHNLHDESVTKHLMFMDPENEKHVDHVFKHFKKNFNKQYVHEDEHAMRKSILRRNMRLITSTNRQKLGYKLAVNQFADRTPEEMKRHMGLLRRPEGQVGTDRFPYNESKLREISETLPSEYDLRLLGVISPVKNQENCGSCWTFGTTAAVEGALARSNGFKLKWLSNQALIDCAWAFGAAGCDGGTDTAAYQWMMQYGLPTEEEYGTYSNQDGYCHMDNMTDIYPIKGFVDVNPNSVGALKVAIVNHGPLSVSVHVTDAFSAYSSGVFYDVTCNPAELNHEITLVGYGEAYGEPFWIVKNSWGPHWGIDGYMHISARDNNCGIMTEPTYVLF